MQIQNSGHGSRDIKRSVSYLRLTEEIQKIKLRENQLGKVSSYSWCQPIGEDPPARWEEWGWMVIFWVMAGVLVWAAGSEFLEAMP